MSKTVVALYEDVQRAEQAVRALQDAGFERSDISVIAANRETGQSYTTDVQDTGSEAGTGAAVGAGTGAVLGGLAGLVIGLGALAIPGIGPIIAAGPIATTLAGAGAGAVAGGLVGALVGAGVPENDARLYNEGVRGGGTLVTVRASDEEANRAAGIMNRFYPVDIDTKASTWSQVPATEDVRSESRMDDTLRTTEVRTEDYGSSRTGTQDFDTFNSDFRNHFELVYIQFGRAYDYYEPGYRYGYDLARMDRYHGKRWSEIEPDAQREADRTHPGNTWDSFKEAIRHAWERVTGAATGSVKEAGFTPIPRQDYGSEYGTGEGRTMEDRDTDLP